MADNTRIEWCDATWNPIVGCSVVSPGCTNCYAMRLAGERMRHHPSRVGLTEASKAGPVWNGQVRLYKPALDQPLDWRRPRRIFVCAHGDLFHEAVPDEWIDRVYAVMALAPQHAFIVLTKRAKRMRDYLSDALDGIEVERWRIAGPQPALERQWPLPNVWIGASAEDQERADLRIPHVLATPAALRLVSLEPLLGPVDIRQYLGDDPLYGREQAERGIRLSGGNLRRLGDHAGWHDLARSQAGMGSLERASGEPTMQASEGGTRRRRVPAGSGNGEQGEDLRAGSSLGVPAFQGSDPGGIDDQPRRRTEEAEPSEQPRTGDLFRTADPRHSSSQGRARLPSGRRNEQHGAPDGRTGGSDPAEKSSRGETAVDRKGLRSSVSNDLTDRPWGSAPGIIWCIVGGESGPGARPMELRWLHDIVSQCQAAGVPVFVKQIGSRPVVGGQTYTFYAGGKRDLRPKDRKGVDWLEWPGYLRLREFPASETKGAALNGLV